MAVAQPITAYILIINKVIGLHSIAPFFDFVQGEVYHFFGQISSLVISEQEYGYYTNKKYNSRFFIQHIKLGQPIIAHCQLLIANWKEVPDRLFFPNREKVFRLRKEHNIHRYGCM